MRRYQTQYAECHKGAHWIVKLIWRRINDQRASQADVAERSGLNVGTITKWRRGVRSPRLVEAEAVLNALGYRLVVKSMEDEDGGQSYPENRSGD